MRIAWDLDGVLRDLYGYLNHKLGIPYQKDWFWKYQGKDIFDWIEQDNFLPLIYAPTTDYYWIVKHCFDKPEIWTCQPELWKPKTEIWIKHHFEDCEVHYLSTEEKRQKLDDNPDMWLVEDSPNFSHWDRILLIDTPHNRHIKEVDRIHTIGELDEWILKKLDTHTVKAEV
ncbi:MAG: hypothetical protein NTZ48_07080 [Candidatus Omnitrophica bacterium]|nr:hypothetical protein [Candidatus Omnitrophota bacterium]